MKNQTILTLLALIYFAHIHAGMYRLNYTLPNEPENWIENVFMLEDIIIVNHQTGITVSSDGGLSFREAKIETPFRSDYYNYSDACFISSDRSVFLISTNHAHLISSNSGIIFEKIVKSPAHGFYNVFQDQINFYCTTNYYYNEGMHSEYFFISRDKGRTWDEVIVGSNDSENVQKIFMYDNILYVLTRDNWPRDHEEHKLYRSDDHGNTYKKIDYKPDADLFNQSQRDTSLFLKRWNELNLDMPALDALNHSGNYSFSYKNNEFNRTKPARGLFYERPSGGCINANLAPRNGGFISAAKGKIYYSSFKDIWVER